MTSVSIFTISCLAMSLTVASFWDIASRRFSHSNIMQRISVTLNEHVIVGGVLFLPSCQVWATCQKTPSIPCGPDSMCKKNCLSVRSSWISRSCFSIIRHRAVTSCSRFTLSLLGLPCAGLAPPPWNLLCDPWRPHPFPADLVVVS